MQLSATIDRFVYAGDKKSPDTLRKGRFFIVSTFLFVVFALVGFVAMLAFYERQEYNSVAFYMNLGLLIFPFAPFLIYKKFGYRVALVNWITFSSFVTSASVWDSGGIYSTDNIWAIVISCWVFLVADKRSGVFWFVITVIGFFALQIGEVNQLNDFRADLNKTDSSYAFMNYVLAAVFLCIIIILHENGKEKYLKEIVAARAEAEEQRKIADHRNREITDSILYARKIQRARMSNEVYVERSLRRLNRS